MSSKRIKTPEFRVSFPHLFKPQVNKWGTGKYSVAMLFSKETELATLREIVKEAVTEKWGSNRPKSLKLPFRDGADKDFDGYGEGVTFASATSKEPFPVVDQGVKAIPESQADRFYPGCYAVACIVAYAYDEGSPGVAFGLNGIQKTREGERIGGKRIDPQSFFDPIKVSESSTEVDNLFDLDKEHNDAMLS